jgi:chromosome segregation ATPase
MFGTAKLFMVGILAIGLAGGAAYVYKLKADNEVLKANAIKMESAIEDQKTLIENQKKDFAEIVQANQQMNELINTLKKDIDDLDKRFNKKDRDIGKLAVDKSKAIERIINKASDKAARCIEIASGSPLTEEEKNATKKSEINTECPSIANPNYIPY